MGHNQAKYRINSVFLIQWSCLLKRETIRQFSKKNYFEGAIDLTKVRLNHKDAFFKVEDLHPLVPTGEA